MCRHIFDVLCTQINRLSERHRREHDFYPWRRSVVETESIQICNTAHQISGFVFADLFVVQRDLIFAQNDYLVRRDLAILQKSRS